MVLFIRDILHTNGTKCQAGCSSGSTALTSKCKGSSDRECMTCVLAVWAIFYSSQWSTTDPSKAVICAVLSVGKCIIKIPCWKSSLCDDSGFCLKKYVTMSIFLTSNSR